jgi:hypothetical protein
MADVPQPIHELVPSDTVQPEEKLHPRYCDSSAAFVLVSSDGNLFYVQEYHLLSQR